jgi:hypothetical protein
MRCQLRLGAELHAAFLSGGSPAICARQDASQDASTDRRGEIQPLPVERLEGCATPATRSMILGSPKLVRVVADIVKASRAGLTRQRDGAVLGLVPQEECRP